MKKLLLIVMTFVMMFAIASPTLAFEMPIYESDKPLTIHIDGKFIATDTAPVIQNGRTLLPLRVAAEYLGANVEWNQSKQTASIIKNDVTVNFTINNKVYTINSEARNLDVAPQIINNRTLIPLRAFAEALNTSVDWNSYSYDISIKTGETMSHPNIPKDSNKEVEWLLEKYYIQSDSTDPFVGSWKTTRNYDGEKSNNNLEKYLFISKGETSYRVNSVNFTTTINKDFYSCQTPHWTTTIVESRNGYSYSTNKFRTIGENIPDYYKGPPTGFQGKTITEFVIEDNLLINNKSFFEFEGEIIPNDETSTYTRI